MFLKEQCLGRALVITSLAWGRSIWRSGAEDLSPAVKKASCRSSSQPLKCYSDVTFSNELSLSGTPPGSLFATTNTSVIAAFKSRSPNGLFEQGCKVQPLRSPEFCLCSSISKVSAPVNILLLDSRHSEHKAKVVWLRTSWQALRHGREKWPLQTSAIPPANVLDLTIGAIIIIIIIVVTVQ